MLGEVRERLYFLVGFFVICFECLLYFWFYNLYYVLRLKVEFMWKVDKVEVIEWDVVYFDGMKVFWWWVFIVVLVMVWNYFCLFVLLLIGYDFLLIYVCVYIYI